MKNISVKNILSWLNENLLLCLSLFLVAFIPLWPKIPVFQPIPGYIVRIRLEDFFVGFTAITWSVQALRRKVTANSPLNIFMFLYVLVGLLSLLSAMFWIKTFPLLFIHVAKAFLIWLRYSEYFSLFFFVYASIKKKQHAVYFLIVIFFTIAAATLYGAGQKYFQWPVYSTMNAEFSSGVMLELANPYARVQSTFAGHYDFAIYLSLTLPFLLLAIYLFYQRKEYTFVALASAIFALGIWGIIVSGLRSAFASLLIAIVVVTIGTGIQTQKKIKWVATKLVIVFVSIALMYILFGSNLSALLRHAYVGVVAPNQKNQVIEKTIISQYVLPVPKDKSNTEALAATAMPTKLSGCALQREISLCIRLESLWPQAIKGFLREPLLGSGFSTLNKRDFYHLAEADGADNNYLRILGETGILGFITLFAIILRALWIAYQKARKQKNISVESIIYIGYIGTTIGLLCNALLFDVFAASKVAFTFWALTGLMMGFWKSESREPSLANAYALVNASGTQRRQQNSQKKFPKSRRQSHH